MFTLEFRIEVASHKSLCLRFLIGQKSLVIETLRNVFVSKFHSFNTNVSRQRNGRLSAHSGDYCGPYVADMLDFAYHDGFWEVYLNSTRQVL